MSLYLFIFRLFPKKKTFHFQEKIFTRSFLHQSNHTSYLTLFLIIQEIIHHLIVPAVPFVPPSICASFRVPASECQLGQWPSSCQLCRWRPNVTDDYITWTNVLWTAVLHYMCTQEQNILHGQKGNCIYLKHISVYSRCFSKITCAQTRETAFRFQCTCRATVSTLRFLSVGTLQVLPECCKPCWPVRTHETLCFSHHF